MRPAFRLAALSLVLVACASPDAASDTASATPRVDLAAEEKTIRDLDARLLDAVQRRDTTAIAGFYASGGLSLIPGSPPLRGPEGARKAWGRRLAMSGASTRFTPTIVDVAANGDMAWEVGTYATTTARASEQGKYVHVWRKFGADWKIVADIFNSDGAAKL